MERFYEFLTTDIRLYNFFISKKVVFVSGAPGAFSAWDAQDANLNSGWRMANHFHSGGNQTRPGATSAVYNRQNTIGCH